MTAGSTRRRGRVAAHPVRGALHSQRASPSHVVSLLAIQLTCSLTATVANAPDNGQSGRCGTIRANAPMLSVAKRAARTFLLPIHTLSSE